jgi:peptidoglycan/xylan/chitin deacetylase (PgdA/CDA1 family)
MRGAAILLIFLASGALAVLGVVRVMGDDRADTVLEQLTRTNEALGEADVRPVLWRPPYRRSSPSVDAIAERMGMAKALWTIDPEDYSNVGRPEVVVDAVLRDAEDRGVVLLHDGHRPPEHDDTGLRAVERILPRLLAQGYCFGPLSVVDGAVTVRRPPRCAKVLALTFDDGPDPEVTPKVLATLERFNVRATFFMVGQRADEHPDIVRDVREAGHAVGNHTWDHADLTSMRATAR